MPRFLLLPGNNTLSHVAKCLALRSVLEARGHEAVLAVSAARAAFLDRLGERRYHLLPDIQEADGGALPGFVWFRPERVETVVRAETQLIREIQPDAVLGVFRFTGPLSAALTSIPYDSLICGAMTPALPDVLGFAADEPGAAAQAEALQFFRRTCAQRLQPALQTLGLPRVDDILRLQVGRRTFLWDTPEFQPLPPMPGYSHVGPIDWNGWPQPAVGLEALDRLQGKIAFVSFGTGHAPPALLRHLIDALWQQGYAVALALGGQSATGLPNDPVRLAVFEFLPVELILERAALVVCHGGQLLIFEALRQRRPVFVLPLQPEQAQNGVCLERLGCGRRLLRCVVFTGMAAELEAAFIARPAQEIADEMSTLLDHPQTPARLTLAAEQLARYRGAEALAEALEQVA